MAYEYYCEYDNNQVLLKSLNSSITGLSQYNYLSAINQNYSSISSINIIMQLYKYDNIESLLKIQDDYPYLTGIIIPLTLNNEFNINHKYDNSNTIIFPQYDFNISFSSKYKHYISPELTETITLNEIVSMPFRQNFSSLTVQSTNNNILDFTKSKEDIITTFINAINNSFTQSGSYIGNTNLKQILYFNRIIFPDTGSELSNKVFGGIIVLMNENDKHSLSANNNIVNSTIYPIEYKIQLDITNGFGLSKLYNSKVRDDLFNLDFRNHKIQSFLNSDTIMFSMDKTSSNGNLKFYELPIQKSINY